MNYTRLFDPDNRARSQTGGTAGMADDSKVDYVYSAPVILAVNLALATRRPQAFPCTLAIQIICI